MLTWNQLTVQTQLKRPTQGAPLFFVFYITLNLSNNPQGLLRNLHQSPQSLAWNNRKRSGAVSKSWLRWTTRITVSPKRLITFRITKEKCQEYWKTPWLERLLVLFIDFSVTMSLFISWQVPSQCNQSFIWVVPFKSLMDTKCCWSLSWKSE